MARLKYNTIMPEVGKQESLPLSNMDQSISDRNKVAINNAKQLLMSGKFFRELVRDEEFRPTVYTDDGAGGSGNPTIGYGTTNFKIKKDRNGNHTLHVNGISVPMVMVDGKPTITESDARRLVAAHESLPLAAEYIVHKLGPDNITQDSVDGMSGLGSLAYNSPKRFIKFKNAMEDEETPDKAFEAMYKTGMYGYSTKDEKYNKYVLRGLATRRKKEIDSALSVLPEDQREDARRRHYEHIDNIVKDSDYRKFVALGMDEKTAREMSNDTYNLDSDTKVLRFLKDKKIPIDKSKWSSTNKEQMPNKKENPYNVLYQPPTGLPEEPNSTETSNESTDNEIHYPPVNQTEPHLLDFLKESDSRFKKREGRPLYSDKIKNKFETEGMDAAAKEMLRHKTMGKKVNPETIKLRINEVRDLFKATGHKEKDFKNFMSRLEDPDVTAVYKSQSNKPNDLIGPQQTINEVPELLARPKPSLPEEPIQQEDVSIPYANTTDANELQYQSPRNFTRPTIEPPKESVQEMLARISMKATPEEAESARMSQLASKFGSQEPDTSPTEVPQLSLEDRLAMNSAQISPEDEILMKLRELNKL